MKTALLPLLLVSVMMFTPAAAFAQPQPPGPPPPPPDGPRMQFSAAERAKMQPIMDSARAQMDALHAEQLQSVRSKISGAHFAAIQKIAQAARSAPPPSGPRPDRDSMRETHEAAGHLMSAVLTPAERDGVISVLLASRERARAIAKATLEKTKSVLKPEEQQRISERLSHEMNGPPDPGRFLAMLTMPRPNPPQPPPAPPPPPR